MNIPAPNAPPAFNLLDAFVNQDSPTYTANYVNHDVGVPSNGFETPVRPTPSPPNSIEKLGLGDKSREGQSEDSRREREEKKKVGKEKKARKADGPCKPLEPTRDDNKKGGDGGKGLGMSREDFCRSRSRSSTMQRIARKIAN